VSPCKAFEHVSSVPGPTNKVTFPALQAIGDSSLSPQSPRPSFFFPHFGTAFFVGLITQKAVKLPDVALLCSIIFSIYLTFPHVNENRVLLQFQCYVGPPVPRRTPVRIIDFNRPPREQSHLTRSSRTPLPTHLQQRICFDTLPTRKSPRKTF